VGVQLVLFFPFIIMNPLAGVEEWSHDIK